MSFSVPVPNFNWHFGSHFALQPTSAVAASSGTSIAKPKKTQPKVVEVEEEEEEEVAEEEQKNDPIEPADELEAPEGPSVFDTRQAASVPAIGYQFGVVKKFGK